MLFHGAVSGRRERPDPLARPDEREAQSEAYTTFPAGPLSVHEPLPERCRLALLHARPELLRDVLHRRRCDLVRQPHALDLLRRLDRPCARQERRRVDRRGEGIEPGLREGGRLTHHPVGGLGAERELEPDLLVGLGRLQDRIERACQRGPRIVRVVAGNEHDGGRPGGVGCVLGRRLDRDQDRWALPRKHGGVVALHPPEVREIENVVGGADDERVEVLLGHQPLDPIELELVVRPAHNATRGGAGSPWPCCHEITGLRRIPIFSISASITSPGFR